MRLTTTSFATILLSLAAFSSAQAQLLSWNTFGNAGTETTEPSIFNSPFLISANLTLGAGVTAAANGNRFGGSNWFDTGDTAAGGQTLTQAIGGNDFIQFIVTPNSGNKFTPTSFTFYWDRSGTGPNTVTLRSSIDSFAADIGTVTGLTSGGTFSQSSIAISGLTDVTTPTTFRLYGYGSTSTATAGTGGFDSQVGPPDISLSANVVLNGTASPIVPEPSTYAALAGLAVLGLAALRRRKS